MKNRRRTLYNKDPKKRLSYINYLKFQREDHVGIGKARQIRRALEVVERFKERKKKIDKMTMRDRFGQLISSLNLFPKKKKDK